ncbi:MAG: hypothetical protein ACD_49C00026G0011 [uncultured bacterium (gcode 4)]|uniref:Uncharacterized protein n=1 Tax=uncultured bacterium (gcode 4) TaxID=1234023 RepID=K2AY25_9BACT|nr:MAG: hypothetical protein ACD_49C00026G0011 [uncultured bacterium (gcode 4)]
MTQFSNKNNSTLQSSFLNVWNQEIKEKEETQSIIEITWNTQKNLWKLLTWVSLFSLLSSQPVFALDKYELLASNELSSGMLVEKNNPENVKKFLLDVWMGTEFAQSVASLSAKNLEARKKWEIPKDYIFQVESINSIKSKKDLSQIVNNWELLPELKEKIPDITRENYKDVIGKLYNMQDLSIWLRSPNNSALTKEQFNSYLDEKASEKQRWLAKIEDFDKKYPGAVEEWFKLFNESKKQLTFNSRETQRRLLVNAWSVVFYKNVSEKGKQALAPLAASSTAEILFLTNPNLPSWWAKLTLQNDNPELKPLKYIIPSDTQILSNSLLKDMQGVWNVALNGIGKEYSLKEKSAKLDEKSAKLDEHLYLTNKISLLSNEIEKLVKQYIEIGKTNEILKNEINNKIVEIEKLKKEIDLRKNENFSGALAQYNIAKLWIDKFKKY